MNQNTKPATTNSTDTTLLFIRTTSRQNPNYVFFFRLMTILTRAIRPPDLSPLPSSPPPFQSKIGHPRCLCELSKRSRAICPSAAMTVIICRDCADDQSCFYRSTSSHRTVASTPPLGTKSPASKASTRVSDTIVIMQSRKKFQRRAAKFTDR